MYVQTPICPYASYLLHRPFCICTFALCMNLHFQDGRFLIIHKTYLKYFYPLSITIILNFIKTVLNELGTLKLWFLLLVPKKFKR